MLGFEINSRSLELAGYTVSPLPPIDAPFDVEVVDGEVVFIGAGAVAFAMTMAAASETARRLKAALEAEGDAHGSSHR
jgi:hypothetical protein